MTSGSDIEHDLPLGKLHACQVCGAQDLELVIDLGHQPPCDSLLTESQLDDSETTYPLRFMRCPACGLAQIDYVVEPAILFHPEYPYRSGITDSLRRNLHATAATVIERSRIAQGSLVIDIGSNDGTLLQGFADQGMRVLGVEATNVAKLAIEAGIDTVQGFFDRAIAREIREGYGPAALITATNMFAHVQNLGELIEGVSDLLIEGGVFVTESHYLLDLLERVQYDSIYHEHLKYYSLRPLEVLFKHHGFSLVDVDRIANYGGSIRVYAVKGDTPSGEAVGRLMEVERNAGVYAPSRYRAFADAVRENKYGLIQAVTSRLGDGDGVPGIGCPGRASTLLNYTGLGPDFVPYIAEQSTSLKLGLHLPGLHTPVVDEERLFREQPRSALMLSWHYAEPIIRTLRSRGFSGEVILPLPDVHVERR